MRRCIPNIGVLIRAIQVTGLIPLHEPPRLRPVRPRPVGTAWPVERALTAGR